MDYIGNKCPVCSKYFHADDDVVVCPDCGTPHHRECYEQTGHCIHEDLHAQGYDYEEEQNKETAQEKVCPRCGHAVDDESFFCKNCGTPLSAGRPGAGQGTQNGAPFTGPGQNQDQSQGNPAGFNVPFMDPLGGVPNETDFGDGVTAGETAKYVKQNTPYFIRVFSNIKNFNKSKFNFAAAIFTGGYLLYRKMYKFGAIIASLQLLLMIVEVYLTIAYSSLYSEFTQLYASSSDATTLLANFSEFLNNMSPFQLLVLYLPTLIDLMRIALMLSIGFCFNRMYFKHCKKQINRIKETASPDENPESILQTKGGVNMPLAISLMVTYLVVVYLPNFITVFT